MWNIASRAMELFAARYQLGVLHGSEDISMLLYSLVRREKPEVLVELGTGLGASSVWIAAALKENGRGMLHTYDNGSHFAKDNVKRFVATLRGPLAPLAEGVLETSYEAFIGRLFELCDVADHVASVSAELDLADVSQIVRDVDNKDIDLLFSDYTHSLESVERIVAAFLPRMASTSSIFIDSASSHRPSFLGLERLVDLLNQRKLPRRIADLMDEPARAKVERLLATSKFTLLHLMEKLDRAQNSTAWLRIEPADLAPPVTTFFH